MNTEQEFGGRAAALSGWNWKHRKSGWEESTLKSLSEQGLPNHGTAAAGNDGDWLAGGTTQCAVFPEECLFGAYWYYRTVITVGWTA